MRTNKDFFWCHIFLYRENNIYLISYSTNVFLTSLKCEIVMSTNSSLAPSLCHHSVNLQSNKTFQDLRVDKSPKHVEIYPIASLKLNA